MSKPQHASTKDATYKRKRTSKAESDVPLNKNEHAQARKQSTVKKQVPSQRAKTVENAGDNRKQASATRQKAKHNSAKRKQRQKASMIRLAIRGVFIAACLLLVWCLYAYYVIIFNEQKPIHKADAGIVLGAALWNEQPSPALKERLDYAIELYEQDLFDYFILSGGKPPHSRGISEAEGMKQYLMKAGVPENRLLLETQSSDTHENLLYSARVAEHNDLTSAIIITHNYHTKRAEDIAHFVGLDQVQAAGVKTKVLNESYHYTREMLAYTKWQINKLIMPLGLSI